MKLQHFFRLLLIASLFYGCRVQLVNIALQSIGIFEDRVKLTKLVKDANEVTFIPMHHAGTEKFYADVKKKVDSLEQEDYFIYWEKIKSEDKDSIIMDTLSRKFRKITGVFQFKNDFAGVLDSITKNKFHKLKKTLINQPSYWELGVDSLHSRNVDATVSQMIAYHEKKYGVVVLETCDFETKLSQINSCERKHDKVISNDIIVNFRNQIILTEIDKEIKNKIAIIYGENHFKGIKEGLIERGYQEVSPPQ
jgi:hypothetical protein